MQRYLVDPVNGLPTARTLDGSGVQLDQRFSTYHVATSPQFLRGGIEITATWTPALPQTQPTWTPQALAPAQPTWTPQALAPAQPTWTPQALAPTFLTCIAPAYYALAPTPAPITIVDPTRYTLSAPQRIHNNAGNKYSWQQDVTNRNYNVLGNQGYAIYSAMHVDNITGASKARDGDHLYANFSSEIGNTNRFQGLRLGEFVYFNFTNQDIFVGGIGNGGGFRVPANNPSQVSEIHPQTSPASQITYVNDSEFRRQHLALMQSKSDLKARDDAFKEVKSLQQTNTRLTIVSQRQLKSIQYRECKLNEAEREIERLQRQSEFDKMEFDRKAKYAASVQLFEDSQRNSSMLRAGREARAAAEQRAKVAEQAQAAEQRAQADAERTRAAAEDRAVIEVDRLQQQLKNAVKDNEQTSLKLIQSEHRWQQWFESDKREQNQRAQVIPSERLETAEGRAAETETLRLQQERDAARAAQAAAERERDAAKEEIAILKGSISSFRDSLENIKTQFEKLKNLFGSEDIKTKPKPNIEYKQGDRKNNFKLKWILNLDELKKKTTGYNIFLKFTVFSDDQQSEEEQQKALSQVALLKLKLIELGKNNDSAQFLNHKETIKGYLSDVSNLMAVNNFDLNDGETKEFCQEYFSLGQQYKKILEKEKNKPDSNIKKMMSCEFKKDKICYDNESAQEYLGFDENRFEDEFTLVSSKEFNSIINAHSHSSDKTNAKAKAKDDANDDAKKNDDKIILLNSFILSLEQACKGHEEIVKDSSNQIEISPEVAKVFVTLNKLEAEKLWDNLSYEKQIQLKEFLEKELQYSQVEQEGVVERSKIDIDKYVEERKKEESSWMFLKFFDKRITKETKQKLEKKFYAPTKEVSDFFEERKLLCEELLNYKAKDKPEDLPLSRQEGVNSAVKKKSDEFSNFLDLLNQVIIKFNENFRQFLSVEGEEELLPAPASAPASDPGAGVRPPAHAAPATATATATAPPPTSRQAKL